VVGVVPDLQQNFRRPLQRESLICLPYTEPPQPVMFIVARTSIPPSTLADGFGREVQSLKENFPLDEVRFLADRMAQSRPQRGFRGGRVFHFGCPCAGAGIGGAFLGD
jgi:hypothetical protein